MLSVIMLSAECRGALILWRALYVYYYACLVGYIIVVTFQINFLIG